MQPERIAEVRDWLTKFTSLEDAAIALTPYAVAFRYPGEVTLPTVEQAEEGRRFMHEVCAFVATWLPSEAMV